uniref:ELYS-bb domain-containing protein n=1 Tax=Rhabditophanes sp. KR3021 TaxID=114890 RepID=A0AC35TT02_9BILA
MRLKNGSHGIVAAITKFDENSNQNIHALYLLSIGPDPVILNSIRFIRECKKVFVVYDDTQTDEIKKLDDAFSKYPHLICVGMGEGCCYLTAFDRVTKAGESFNDLPKHPSKGINFLKIMHDKANGLFLFPNRSGDLKVKMQNVEVTSVTFVKGSTSLVVGFNFGGLMSVNLVTQTRHKIRICKGEIRSMEIQDPDDDPRPTSYIWAACVSENVVSFKLISLLFHTDPDNPAIVNRNKMSMNVRLDFAADNCDNFLSMRPVLRERNGGKGENTTRNGDTARKDSTLMLFTWVNFGKNGISLEGSLFDLNMFYYKRLVGQIRDDRTLARQSPFFTRFSMMSPDNVNLAALLDIHLSPTSLFRAKSNIIENVDQFFYPSTYGFELMAFTKDCKVALKCDPIQVQFFNRLQPLDKSLKELDFVMGCMVALGFMTTQKQMQFESEEEKMSAVLSVLLHHEGSFLIISMIKTNKLSDSEMEEFVDWLYKEIEDCDADFQRIASMLFEDNSEELYAINRRKVNHYILIFDTLKTIIENLASCQVPSRIKNNLSVKMKIVNTFLVYSKILDVLARRGLFPITEEVLEVHSRLATVYNERKTNSLLKGRELLIDQFIEGFENTSIGSNRGNVSFLYPPQNPAVYVNLLLASDVLLEAKIRLISYYVLDLCSLIGNDLLYSDFINLVVNYFKSSFEIDIGRMKNAWTQDTKKIESLDKEIIRDEDVLAKCLAKKETSIEEIHAICNRSFISREEFGLLREKLLKEHLGIFKWNYVAARTEEFNMIVKMSELIPKDKSDDWVAFCTESKQMYDVLATKSIMWKFKLPSDSVITKKLQDNRTKFTSPQMRHYGGAEKENSTILTGISNSNNASTDQTDVKNYFVVATVDEDFVKLKNTALNYQNILKTPISASRWVKTSKLPDEFLSPQQSVMIDQPVAESIMKSNHRVSRIRPNFKIGSRIRFDLPDHQSTTASTIADDTTSEDLNKTIDHNDVGSFYIDKSTPDVELSDVKTAYSHVLEDKINNHSVEVIKRNDGRNVSIEHSCDEEILMKNMMESPAQTAEQLIGEMELASKDYGISLPKIHLLGTPDSKLNGKNDNDTTPVLLRKRIIQKKLNFKDVQVTGTIDDTISLKRKSFQSEEEFMRDLNDIKKVKIGNISPLKEHGAKVKVVAVEEGEEPEENSDDLIVEVVKETDIAQSLEEEKNDVIESEAICGDNLVAESRTSEKEPATTPMESIDDADLAGEKEVLGTNATVLSQGNTMIGETKVELSGTTEKISPDNSNVRRSGRIKILSREPEEFAMPTIITKPTKIVEDSNPLEDDEGDSQILRRSARIRSREPSEQPEVPKSRKRTTKSKTPSREPSVDVEVAVGRKTPIKRPTSQTRAPRKGKKIDLSPISETAPHS